MNVRQLFSLSCCSARRGSALCTMQRTAGQCLRFVLVTDCRMRSLKKNRTSDKLELTLSDMSEVLLFFLFVSLPAVPAPAEDAPTLLRSAQPVIKNAPVFSGCGSRSCG